MLKGNFVTGMLSKFLLVMLAVCLLLLAMLLLSTCSHDDTPAIDIDSVELVQLEQPKNGDPIAIITTSVGELRVRLYPEYAPQTVALFKQLADSGYYDNTYVCDVESNVYFMAGTAATDGVIAEGSAGDVSLDNELHQNLWPFKGAMLAVNSTLNSSGSRFIFCDTVEMDDEFKQALLDVNENTMLADAFIENGGIPNFSQVYTIFAQTYEGLDVIDAITSCALGGEENRLPVDDIKIISVRTGTYDGE